jgi:hypothetical protein
MRLSLVFVFVAVLATCGVAHNCPTCADANSTCTYNNLSPSGSGSLTRYFTCVTPPCKLWLTVTTGAAKLFLLFCFWAHKTSAVAAKLQFRFNLTRPLHFAAQNMTVIHLVTHTHSLLGCAFQAPPLTTPSPPQTPSILASRPSLICTANNLLVVA